MNSRHVISERLLWATALLLGLLPIAVATDFGGVLPWTKYVAALAVVGGAAVALCGRGLASGTFGEPLLQSTAFRPAGMLLLLAGYGGLQTLPIPAGLVAWLSPASHSAHVSWAGPLLESGASEWISLSVAAFDSMHAVAVLMVLSVLAFASVFVFGQRDRMTWLLWSLVIAGSTIAVVGAARKLVPGFHLWSFQSGGEGAPFGTFLNRNNAALGINFGIAASIGLLVYRWFTLGSAGPGESRFGDLRSGGGKWTRLVRDPSTAVATIGAVIGLSGLVVCGSRGGMLSMTIAAGVTFWAYRRHTARAAPYLIVVAAIALSIFFLLRSETLSDQSIPRVSVDRLESTVRREADRLSLDTRLRHWPDGARTAVKHFPCGSGLASYGFAYLPWQQSSPWRHCQHADNLWLELAVELGLPGVLWLLASVWLTYSSVKRLRQSPDALDQGLAACGGYALVVVLVSQVFDFGLILVSNALVAVMLFAVTASRATMVAGDRSIAGRNRPLQLRRPGDAWWKPSSLIREQTFQLAACLPLLGLAIPAMGRLRRDAISDAWVRTLPAERERLQFDFAKLTELAGVVDDVALRHPDPELLAELAAIEFQRGRLRELAAAGFGRLPSDQQLERYAATTRSNRHLGWRASREEFAGRVSHRGRPVEAMPIDDAALAEGTPYRLALQHTEAGLRSRPLALRQRMDEVFLEFVHQTPERTVLALHQAGDLFRNTPELLLRFGSEFADLGEFSLAADHWQRAVVLRPAMLGRVLGRGVHYQNFPLDEVIPDQSELRRRADEWFRGNGMLPPAASGSSSRHSVRSNP